MEREHWPQVVIGRVVAERVHAVNRDPGPDHVEVAGGVGDHRGAVCRMEFHLREFPACPLPQFGQAVPLQVTKGRVFFVGRGEMRPERGQPEVRMRVGRSGQFEHEFRVGGAEPAHAGVVLHVNPDDQPGSRRLIGQGGDEARLPGGDVGAGRDRHLDFTRGEGADHQHRDVRCDAAGQHRLGRGGEGNPVGPGLGHGTDTVKRAVPVGIGLQDRTKLHPLIEA